VREQPDRRSFRQGEVPRTVHRVQLPPVLGVAREYPTEDRTVVQRDLDALPDDSRERVFRQRHSSCDDTLTIHDAAWLDVYLNSLKWFGRLFLPAELNTTRLRELCNPKQELFERAV